VGLAQLPPLFAQVPAPLDAAPPMSAIGCGAIGGAASTCAARKVHDGVSARDSAGRARRRLLVPYTFGAAHLALSNLLCLAGAVAGGAGAWALKRYGHELWADEKGAPDWLVRLSRQPAPHANLRSLGSGLSLQPAARADTPSHGDCAPERSRKSNVLTRLRRKTGIISHRHVPWPPGEVPCRNVCEGLLFDTHVK